ncbi:hypothetical protein [Lacrimispora sp.]|nr:hypothetical protein [Lacrimispora sp.]
MKGGNAINRLQIQKKNKAGIIEDIGNNQEPEYESPVGFDSWKWWW